MAKRIVVIANKSWEAEPLVNVLVHEKAVPKDLGAVELKSRPLYRDNKIMQQPVGALPRMTITVGGKVSKETHVTFKVAGDVAKEGYLTFKDDAKESPVTIEVWCLQDLMDPQVSSSLSLEKVRVLPQVFQYSETAPALVIAFGTAALPGDLSMNGSVFVGSKVFIHDPYATETDRRHRWTPPCPDQILDSPDPPVDLLGKMDVNSRYPAEGRFLTPPVLPSSPPRILAGHAFVSLGTVNVTNYEDYAWTDGDTLAAFRQKVGSRKQVGSMETTHGLIRLASESPFLYVSGITDTVGRFDLEVTPRVYAQNFVAAHNAGLAVAWMLPQVVPLL